MDNNYTDDMINMVNKNHEQYKNLENNDFRRKYEEIKAQYVVFDEQEEQIKEMNLESDRINEIVHKAKAIMAGVLVAGLVMVGSNIELDTELAHNYGTPRVTSEQDFGKMPYSDEYIQYVQDARSKGVPMEYSEESLKDFYSSQDTGRKKVVSISSKNNSNSNVNAEEMPYSDEYIQYVQDARAKGIPMEYSEESLRDFYSSQDNNARGNR